MAEKKITFIIPGFRHKPSSKAYQQIAKMLKEQGHIPVPITIPWKQSTISENTEYFIHEFKRKLMLKSKMADRRKTYILGFSFGAMIALIASTKLRVSGLILCSLSPYFKEDLPKTKNVKKTQLERDRYHDFMDQNFGKLAKQIKAEKILMFYGCKESKPLIKRVTKAYRKIPSLHKYLLPISHAEHQIGDKRYIQSIRQATSRWL